MWKRLIIGGVSLIMLTACGQAMDEPQTPKQNGLTTDTPNLFDASVNVTGGLPNRADPDIAGFQTRLMAEILEGIPVEVFHGTTPLPSASISHSGGAQPNMLSGPKPKNGRYKMYLVKAPISRLSESSVLACSSNENLYRATIAVKPYLKKVPVRTEAASESVRPYEIHVCDDPTGIVYALAP